MENNDLFDLGSAPVAEDFDPFAMDDELPDGGTALKDDAAENTAQQTKEDNQEPEQAGKVSKEPAVKAPVPGTGTAPKSKSMKTEPGLEEKPPVFAYAGAAETISDTSMTFDELRMEKAGDFPELDDGKRVSWTVEYGGTTRIVADPKGTSIGKMKSDIEASKEFLDSLKKAKDRNPVCRVKPRVTAQSKGIVAEYKGVFATLEDAEKAGKVISIVPSRDGRVYEIRDTEMGKFVTAAAGCVMLSEVRAGFTPALPRIPLKLTMQVLAFFRHYISGSSESEALLNIYWDKEKQEFISDAPEQVVTEVSVEGRISEKYMCDRYIHYMDIHSHNRMGAFFSAIDDQDERATRLYTVVGRMDSPVPEIRTRISNGGKFLDIDPAEVFELMEEPYPGEWEEHVEVKKHYKKMIHKAAFKCGKLGKKLRKKAGIL